jgi:hypothetical protein
MRRPPLIVLLGLAAGGLSAACRTTDEGARPQAAAPALTIHEVADDRPGPPRYERVRGDEVALVEGYGLAGGESCLPLAEGRSCLNAASEADESVSAACSKAGGRLLRCEDCSVLCSKPVDTAP